jgi:hypothetical protein
MDFAPERLMGTARCCSCEGCSREKPSPLMGEGFWVGVDAAQLAGDPPMDRVVTCCRSRTRNPRHGRHPVHCGLTAACNACHQSYDRTMIVIQPPTAAAPFPDQGFRPPAK